MGGGPRQFVHSKVSNPCSKANDAHWHLATEDPQVLGGWAVPGKYLGSCGPNCEHHIIGISAPVVRFSSRLRNIYQNKRPRLGADWEIVPHSWRHEPLIREDLLANPEFDTRVVVVGGANGASIMHYDESWWVMWAMYPHRKGKKWRRVVLHNITNQFALHKHSLTYAGWLERFEELFAQYADNA